MPGLAAKDRADVWLEVADPDDEAAYLSDLLAAGYALHAVEPGHRCLVRADAGGPATNPHVDAEGDEEVGRTASAVPRPVRSDEADRRRYEAVKRAPTRRDWDDVKTPTPRGR